VLTTALLNAGDARLRIVDESIRVDALDIVLFVAACAACAFLFQQGGFIGLAGAVAGFSWRGLRTRNCRRAFKAAFAALCAGMLAGGLFAAALMS
jgi:hypothetical protein